MGKSKNKKPKNELVFDCKERENFLKGFSKRKKQRQKKAQEEIELKLKEERKRIKDESKNLKVVYFLMVIKSQYLHTIRLIYYKDLDVF